MKNKLLNLFLGIVGCLLIITCIVLSSVWVGHIPQTYTYNEALPKPSNALSWTNMNSSIVQNELIKTIEQRKQELAAYQAPAGFKLSFIEIGDSSSSFNMYCLENEESDKTQASPAILYLHGGGFYFPLTADGINSMVYFVKETGAKVFIPDYHTSIESPFPKPLLDCYEAYKYILDNSIELNISPNHILVYGDSAGGCLAASLTQYVRDQNLPNFCGQILIYPVIDNDENYKSIEEYKDAIWSANANRHMWETYLKGVTSKNMKYAVPIQMHDLSNLPNAYVEVAEMDILRDQGLAYADKLKQGGINVLTYEVEGAYHGFDADQENKFVRRILEQRAEIMNEMIRK